MAQVEVSVTVAWSPAPREVIEKALTLPEGSTVAKALEAAKAQGLEAEIEVGIEIGIWGRKALMNQVLREGDRVEIYRPLRVDPKVARRERFEKQGSKRAGLFAQRRAGAKAGY